MPGICLLFVVNLSIRRILFIHDKRTHRSLTPSPICSYLQFPSPETHNLTLRSLAALQTSATKIRRQNGCSPPWPCYPCTDPSDQCIRERFLGRANSRFMLNRRRSSGTESHAGHQSGFCVLYAQQLQQQQSDGEGNCGKLTMTCYSVEISFKYSCHCKRAACLYWRISLRTCYRFKSSNFYTEISWDIYIYIYIYIYTHINSCSIELNEMANKLKYDDNEMRWIRITVWNGGDL